MIGESAHVQTEKAAYVEGPMWKGLCGQEATWEGAYRSKRAYVGALSQAYVDGPTAQGLRSCQPLRRFATVPGRVATDSVPIPYP